MNVFKKIYKEFFGYRLNEQAGSITTKDPKQAEDLAKKGINVTMAEYDTVDEAQLVNNITDYRGGVEYVIRDNTTAQAVADEIKQWSEKKGFTIVKQTISKSGNVGYFYFRLGQDPGAESQKMQGYLAQKPELKHFRFKVRGEQPTSTTPSRMPTRKI